MFIKKNVIEIAKRKEVIFLKLTKEKAFSKTFFPIFICTFLQFFLLDFYGSIINFSITKQNTNDTKNL